MHEWTELDAAPTIPPKLPQLPDGTGAWWRSERMEGLGLKGHHAGGHTWTPNSPHALAGPHPDGGQHGHETYVHVQGDGKASAIYVLTIYTVPLTLGAPAQYPTIPELWHIMTEFCLPGALFAVAGPHGAQAIGVAGGVPPEYRGGQVLQMLQCGCEEGSPAAQRFKLSDVITPGGIISIAGRAQA